MSTKKERIPVDLAIGVIGKWKETYRWIPIFGTFLAFAMAFATGANNLPIPFSTTVGSGTLTFLKASLAACVIYVPGAALASKSTVDALFSDFLRENQPNEAFLMWSMVAVLITATIWLALATYLELPVSSQQSTQGALLGTMLVTEGFNFIPMWNKNENHNFYGGGLLWIVLEWTVAPVIACVLAFCLFRFLKVAVLRHEDLEKRILIFLPVYYGISAGGFCFYLMYQVIPHIVKVERGPTVVSVTLATLLGALLSLIVVVPLARKRLVAKGKSKAIRKNKSLEHHSVESPDPKHIGKVVDDDAKFEDILKDYMEMRVLDTVYEEDERSWASPEAILDSNHVQLTSHATSEQSTPFKQLLESTPNRLVQTRNFQKIENTTSIEKASKFIRDLIKSTLFPVIEYDRHTLIRHALAEKFDEIEDFFGFPQILASSIFALIQSASEVAAVVSPYGAIVDVFRHRARYSGNGEDVGSIHVSWWFRAMGGFGASMGFFLCGWRLTQCLGGKLTYMSNSRGLTSQLSAVTTMVLVTMMKLPVSSSHAFVGSLLGVGVADDPQNVNWKLLIKFLCGWVLTLLFCCVVAYGIYSFSIYSPAYVVP
ncbi:hypothetical protein HHK36_001702 [Tetracentron sinense]|uniref:Phosphate transporter n=1 Tax=Tetracentron sinense TaxID=13715 RepID=A0A834ZXZ7_TETSI|nr:hypothetical protein HHK36_001702 [Tetracentron sinense]